MIYINKNIGYWETPDVLPASYKTGLTEQDYENGAYIPLSDGQIAFRNAHPDAAHLEVLRMKMAEPVVPDLTLEEVKSGKIADIRQYDSSCDVNTFFCDGIATWLTLNERVGWMCSLISARNRGDINVTFPLLGKSFTIPVDMAFSLLDAINGYADRCTNVTEGHIAAVQAMETIEEVETYNYRFGYPEHLQITLSEKEVTA